jgi:hypothetical protein
MRLALAASILVVAAPAYAESDEALKPHDVTKALLSPFEKLFEQLRSREAAKPAAPPRDEPTAADVANAPPPGKEGGRTDGGEHDSTIRDIAQGVLFVPKLAVEVVFAPVRGGIWAYEHYSLRSRFERATFDATNTYGIVPTLHVDSTYGATLGARFIHRNVFGAYERFGLRGGFGGEFNEIVDGNLESGERLGKTTWLQVRGEYERRPRDPYYGIGNNDDAIEVRHRQQIKRGTATLDLLADTNFHAMLAGAITDLDYAVASSGPAIDVMYDTSQLTGWTGTRNLYGELELRYDSRRMTSTPVIQKGIMVDAFAGRVHQLEDGNDYWRYGGDVIHFQPLGIGRTLASRLHMENVSGSTNDVAFTQLPQLGGKSLLRGYPAERFRDRTAVAGSAEYLWDLSSFLLASVFVDAGRVYSGLDALTFDDLRLGYGAAVQIVERRRFVAGVSVASSIDGGLFLNLVLDPVYEPEPRVRQK